MRCLACPNGVIAMSQSEEAIPGLQLDPFWFAFGNLVQHVVRRCAHSYS
jgi:hypothetical protein